MAQTILVADDSATMRQIVSMAFKGSPFQVVAVEGGEAALQAAYDHRPSIILLDYHLPDRSGAEVCRAIKGDPNLRGIPVLMMAGTYHPFDESEARRSGTDDIVVKPFKTDEIHDKVSRLAGSAVMTAGGAPSGVPTPQPAAPTARGTQVGMPAVNVPMRGTPVAASAPARYSAAATPAQPPPRRMSPPSAAPSPRRMPSPSAAPSPRFKSPAEPTRPSVAAPPRGAGAMQHRQAPAPVPVPAPAPVAPAPAAPAINSEEMRRIVREEVQRAVREEMLAMVKSVLGDLFKERMLPKLLNYGQERIESLVARDLQVMMERRVEEELARITGE